jgi:hypothetical protein
VSKRTIIIALIAVAVVLVLVVTVPPLLNSPSQIAGEGSELRGYGLRGGGGENSMNDAVKTITYDNGSDELTIGDKGGEHTYTFSRVTP